MELFIALLNGDNISAYQNNISENISESIKIARICRFIIKKLIITVSDFRCYPTQA